MTQPILFAATFALPNGAITDIDAPGAGLGPGPGTDTAGVNALGVVPGLYVDSSEC